LKIHVHISVFPSVFINGTKHCVHTMPAMFA
jgi:hypothetical protein